jgi:hypothetical protein
MFETNAAPTTNTEHQTYECIHVSLFFIFYLSSPTSHLSSIFPIFCICNHLVLISSYFWPADMTPSVWFFLAYLAHAHDQF